MRPSLAGGLLLLFTICVHAFSLPHSLSLMSINSTGIDKDVNQTLPNLSFDWQMFCRTQYGEHVDAASCHNAWQKIDSSSQTHRFIPASRRSFEPLGVVVMPFRYLSDDGTCAIDLTLRAGSHGDEATGNLVKSTAATLLERCAVRQGIGGTTLGFSRVGDLRITMRSYEPFVDCEPRPPAAPSEESCNAALADMPAYQKLMKFGTGDWRISPGSLPRVIDAYPTSPASCRILVSMPPNLPPTMASWFDIWAAGVAVNTMCVQHGFTGKGIGLGENEEITITLDVVGGGLAQNISTVVGSNLTT